MAQESDENDDESLTIHRINYLLQIMVWVQTDYVPTMLNCIASTEVKLLPIISSELWLKHYDRDADFRNSFQKGVIMIARVRTSAQK